MFILIFWWSFAWLFACVAKTSYCIFIDHRVDVTGPTWVPSPGAVPIYTAYCHVFSQDMAGLRCCHVSVPYVWHCQQVTAAKLRDAARKRKVDGTKVPPSSVTACLAFLQLELCACDRGRRSHAGLNGAEQLNPKQGQCRRDLSSTQTSRSNRLRQELSGSIPVAGLPRKTRTLAARTAA